MEKYDHTKIEGKWQKKWEQDKLYRTDNSSKKEKKYILDMYPYPSGDGLHVGHIEGQVATDIYARFLRHKGFNVLHPMGWDAFGLPAENFAIKTGVPPQETTEKAITNFRSQEKRMGLSFDWDREINSSAPDYYKWTQWLFLELYKNGLAEKKKAPVNWCDSCKTVLANEQVVNGHCERCGHEVAKKDLEQWFAKITDYADQLIDDLDELDWPESTKIAQRNWIGRSEGAKLRFPVAGKFHFVILHGYKSSSEINFHPWIQQELESRGHTVEIPDLPEPDNPQAQIEYVQKNINLTENTVLVGHSLGTIVAMKVLESSKVKVRKLVLAGGFTEPNFKDDRERGFADNFEWSFDFDQIRAQASEITLLHDPNDYAIPESEAKKLERVLQGNLQIVAGEEAHFVGKKEPAVLNAVLPALEVFTTRPDTLYGATYMVVAPEHQFLTTFKDQITNWSEVETYVTEARNKSDIERTAEGKEKTGVRLEGVEAINPATQEAIPIFVADYVLVQYGTGAIMAVPAHDERDGEFAEKFGVEIRQVIKPVFVDNLNPPAEGVEVVPRDVAHVLIRKKSTDEFLLLYWKDENWGPEKPVTFVIGGIEAGEDVIEGAKREAEEETGLTDLKHVTTIPLRSEARFHAAHKGVNRVAQNTFMVFETEGELNVPAEELAIHEPKWIAKEKVASELNTNEENFFWQRYLDEEYTFTGAGKLINSGDFDGVDSEVAKRKITEVVGGEVTTTYKLRDWLISRQRYWGAPIPIVYDPEGNVHMVPEEHLPWLLPTDVDFEPKGYSPLSKSKELFERTEKLFGKGWKPEVDTLDTFVCSSWYFFRFPDPHNETAFADKELLEKWLPVDTYMGGAEHTVLHLLYSRFITKAFRDIGYVSIDEPFTRLRHQGMIHAADGRKMSKSLGNVINPDEVVVQVGADSMRLFEMFMGPVEQMKPWNTDNMAGVRRFLERVWKVSQELIAGSFAPETAEEVARELERTVSKVGKDIETFDFNTAISQMMIFVNLLSEKPTITQEDLERFLIVLAPFAPHMTEELWQQLGHSESIHVQSWPEVDESKLVDKMATIVVQVNGKVRDSFRVAVDSSQEEVEKQAKESPALEKWLGEGEIKKIVFVPNKLINYVL